MSNFYFKARNNNEIVSGYIKASDASSAASKLERKGMIVLEISEEIQQSEYSFFEQDYAHDLILSIKEKKEFFSSLYFQYKSGLPIKEVFRTMSSSASSKNVQALCYRILQSIDTGHTLEEAFAPYQNTVGKEYATLVCSGEKAGKLNEVLESIIKNIAKEEEIKKNIISALTYPAFIMSFAIVIFIFFRTFIFKVFDKMAEGITQEEIFMLLFLSVLKIVISLVIIAIIIILALKNKKIKKKIKDFIFSLPFISKLSKEYYFQNFFTVLSLAFEAGVPAVDSVMLANGVIKISSINRKIQKSIQMLSQGCEITTAFMVSNVFSKFAISQTSAGERAGELDKMFKTIAYDYEKKLEMEINVITKLLEPVIMVFIGIMVLYILYTGYNKYYSSLFSML